MIQRADLVPVIWQYGRWAICRQDLSDTIVSYVACLFEHYGSDIFLDIKTLELVSGMRDSCDCLDVNDLITHINCYDNREAMDQMVRTTS